MSERPPAMTGSRDHAGTETGAATDSGDVPGDDILITRVRSGDREAFALLVRRYHGSLTRVARGYVSTRQSAEELAQEAWLGVMEGLARFEGRASFRTWLFTILVNRAKTRGVREGRSLPFSALGEGEGEPEPAVSTSRFNGKGRWAEPPAHWRDDTPEGLLERSETRAALSAAIESLPDNYRLILTLRDIENLTAEEVCRMLEISEANQRVLLHRARSRVRQALEAHFASR